MYIKVVCNPGVGECPQTDLAPTPETTMMGGFNFLLELKDAYEDLFRLPDIASISLGWTFAYRPSYLAWRNLMGTMHDLEILVFKSAGNEALVTTGGCGTGGPLGAPVPYNISAPANVPPPWIEHADQPPPLDTGGPHVSSVHAVGAVDEDGDLRSTSSRGPAAWEDIQDTYQCQNPIPDSLVWDYRYDTVPVANRNPLLKPDFVAPNDVLSPLVDWDHNPYELFSGTSAAAPHAAGIAALLLSANPDLTSAQVSQAMQLSAVHPTSPGSKDNTYGTGRVDAYRALQYVVENFGATFPITFTIPAGETWSIGDVTLRFADGAYLDVEGTLVADGTTFTEAAVDEGWGGIRLLSGSATLEDALVEHADIGAQIYDPAWLFTDGSTFQHNRVGIDVLSPLDTGNQNRFEETIFNSNGVAIRSDFAECVGTTCSCFGACRSGFSVTNSCVLSSAFDATSGTPGHGIWATNTDARIVGTTVLENDAVGLVTANASVRVGDTRISTNGAGTNPGSDGAQGGADAELRFFDVFDSQTGGNAVHQNAAHEVAGLDEGFVVVGTAYHPVEPPPANSVWKTMAPASGARYVFNGDNSYTLPAEHVYWNTSSGPPSGAFEGLIDSTPYVTTDEASGAGNPACPSPSEFGGSAPEAPAGHAIGETRAGWPQSILGGEGLEALAEAIRNVRAGIRANPLGSEAAQLVRELYALQRLDHDDVLGERTATLELLSELRGRLEQPEVPTGAREPAERALSAEVSEALLREHYSSAAGLVSGPGRRVAGSEVRRRLRYAELTLDLQGRRFESALARVDSLVADLPAGPLGERRSLLDRAAVIAERQDDASARSVAPASVASTSSSGAHAVQLRLGPAVPNPTRGATALRLDLPQAAAVRADVYDLLGRHVAMVVDGDLLAGSHTLRVEGNRFAPGLYIVRATVSRHGTLRTLTQRLTLVR